MAEPPSPQSRRDWGYALSITAGLEYAAAAAAIGIGIYDLASPARCTQYDAGQCVQTARSVEPASDIALVVGGAVGLALGGLLTHFALQSFERASAADAQRASLAPWVRLDAQTVMAGGTLRW
jgi:hypothetical protein